MTGSLNDSVSVLTGVGPKREQALNDLGIATIKDLILYFPFRYNDIRERSLATVNDGDKVLLKGSRISDVTVSYFGRRKNRLAFRMLVNDEPIQVVFFNQPYLKDKINQQGELAIYGRWEAAKQTLLGIRVVGGASDTGGHRADRDRVGRRQDRRQRERDRQRHRRHQPPDEPAHPDHGEHHQPDGEREDRLPVAEERALGDAPAVEEQQRRDEQQQEQVRVERDVEADGRQRRADRDLQQRQRHLGQKARDEAADDHRQQEDQDHGDDVHG